MIHERSKKQKFEGYEEAAGKKLIRKKEKKRNYLVPFQIASKNEKNSSAWFVME
jgi:hypothetical protein